MLAGSSVNGPRDIHTVCQLQVRRSSKVPSFVSGEPPILAMPNHESGVAALEVQSLWEFE
ncbi:hypothetical protein BGZ63DRAFT_395515 [Mariannaea sp. PMI_226]|nr:hypothetical protein BGZ63DRAFT_395515 [Mariannaea sp. PMI_226]